MPAPRLIVAALALMPFSVTVDPGAVITASSLLPGTIPQLHLATVVQNSLPPPHAQFAASAGAGSIAAPRATTVIEAPRRRLFRWMRTLVTP